MYISHEYMDVHVYKYLTCSLRSDIQLRFYFTLHFTLTFKSNHAILELYKARTYDT